MQSNPPHERRYCLSTGYTNMTTAQQPKLLNCELGENTLIHTKDGSTTIASLVVSADSTVQQGLVLNIKRPIIYSEDGLIDAVKWSYVGNNIAYSIVTEKGIRLTCGKNQSFLVVDSTSGEVTYKTAEFLVKGFSSDHNTHSLCVLPAIIDPKYSVTSSFISTEHITRVLNSRMVEHLTDNNTYSNGIAQNLKLSAKQLLDYQWFKDDSGNQLSIEGFSHKIRPLIDRTEKFKYWSSSEYYTDGYSDLLPLLKKICYGDYSKLNYVLKDRSVMDRIIGYTLVRNTKLYSLSVYDSIPNNQIPVFKANGITVTGDA